MAPNTHIVVTLKLAGDKLRQFDFSENKPPALKKPRKRAAPSSGPRSKKADADENGDDDTKQPAGGSAGIINTGGDPVLGSLPRSLKAAPVANTSGLSLDKTPCRKWVQQVVELKTISGYSIGVKAWTSDYTPEEWAEKLKRDAEEERAAAAAEERADTPELTIVPATPALASKKAASKVRKAPGKKPGPKKGSKLKDIKPDISKDKLSAGSDDVPEITTSLGDTSMDQSVAASVDQSVDPSADPSAYPSDNSSEPASEPASDAPSEPASDFITEAA